MTQQRIVKNVLQWQVDQASAQAAVAANEKIVLSLKELQAAAKQVGLTPEAFQARFGGQFTLAEPMKQAAVAAAATTVEIGKQVSLAEELGAAWEADNIHLNRVAASTQATTASLQDQLPVVESLVSAEQARAAAAREVAVAEEQASVASSGARGNIGSGPFGQRRALLGLGSILGTEAGGEVPRDIGQIVGLGAAFGTVGIAAGILAVGLHAVTSEMDAETKALTARLDAERSGAHEIVDLSTRALEQRLETAQQSLVVDKQVADKQLANSLLYQLTIIDQPLAFGKALAGLDPVYNAHQNAIAQNSIALQRDQAFVEVYTKALEDQAGAAGDAAIGAQILLDITDASLAADKLTRDERQKHIDELQTEIDAYTALLNSHTLDKNTTIELAQKINELIVEQGAYAQIVFSTAEALKQLTNAQTAQESAIQTTMDALQAEVEAREALTQTQKEIDKLRSDELEKEQEVIEKNNRRRDEIERAGAERRDDILQEGADRRADIEQQDADRRADILRDFNRDYTNAVAERDQLAAVKAIQRRDDALAKQDLAQKRSLESLEKSQKRQLEAQEKAQQRQLESLEESQREQIDSLRRALAEQVQAKNLELEREQADLEASIQAQQSIRRAANDAEEMLLIAHEGILLFIAQSFAGQIENIWAQMWASMLAQASLPPPLVTGVDAAGNSTGWLPLSDNRYSASIRPLNNHFYIQSADPNGVAREVANIFKTALGTRTPY